MHFITQHLPQCGVEQVGSRVQLGGLLAVVSQAALELLVSTLMAQFLMLLEPLIKVSLIHRQTLFASQLHGHFNGEAEGIVELEGTAAIHYAQGCHAGVHSSFHSGTVALIGGLDDGHHIRRGTKLLGLCQVLGKGSLILCCQDAFQQGLGLQHGVVHLVEFLFALFQCTGKTSFFQAQLLQYEGAVPLQFRISGLVLVDDHLGDLAGEAFRHAQLHSIADSTANQAAKDVALIRVRGTDATVITQDEGGSAHMVGNDAESLGNLIIFPIGMTAQLGNLCQDVGEGIRFVHGLLAGQHADGTLQTHAGIHVLLCQRDERTVCLLVILHEHVIPDFQITAAGAGGRTIGAAGLLIGDDEHFRVRAAGTGNAGRPPPVMLLGQIENMILRHAHGTPDVMALRIPRAVLIAFEHGKGQPILIQSQIFRAGEEFPGPGNSFLLKIIAQGPVAQHFKERQVAGIAYIVNIAGTDALLYVRQPGSGGVGRTHQVRHQRMHTGRGEQHGRIIFRNNGSGLDTVMSLRFHEFLEHFPQLRGSDLLHWGISPSKTAKRATNIIANSPTFCKLFAVK